ncbi:MAG: hypothetical protein M3Z32_09405, partial [Acidobacteriota bacterium]|nr:hypothetical protein [Acidobacteriota bacterium]
ALAVARSSGCGRHFAFFLYRACSKVSALYYQYVIALHVSKRTAFLQNAVRFACFPRTPAPICLDYRIGCIWEDWLFWGSD